MGLLDDTTTFQSKQMYTIFKISIALIMIIIEKFLQGIVTDDKKKIYVGCAIKCTFQGTSLSKTKAVF